MLIHIIAILVILTFLVYILLVFKIESGVGIWRPRISCCNLVGLGHDVLELRFVGDCMNVKVGIDQGVKLRYIIYNIFSLLSVPHLVALCINNSG